MENYYLSGGYYDALVRYRSVKLTSGQVYIDELKIDDYGSVDGCVGGFDLCAEVEVVSDGGALLEFVPIHLVSGKFSRTIKYVKL